jgi:hypothetical protein
MLERYGLLCSSTFDTEERRLSQTIAYRRHIARGMLSLDAMLLLVLVGGSWLVDGCNSLLSLVFWRSY